MFKNFKNLLKKITFKTSNYEPLHDDSIKLYWWNKGVNFGDLLNVELVSRISKRTVEWVPFNYNRSYYMAIGSVIHLAHSKSIIWGSGLMTDKSIPYRKPLKIYAVRGPLTRQRLLSLGIPTPEIYGDPASLMPLFYNPIVDKQFELGIIPHYVETNNEFFLQEFSDKIRIIDVERKNTLKIIDEILQCKRIISSSLHGLIIADAYDIPALHVSFSDKVVGTNFKFFDYYHSVNRKIIKPYQIKKRMSCEEILKFDFSYRKRIDTDKLLQACPFISHND